MILILRYLMPPFVPKSCRQGANLQPLHLKFDAVAELGLQTRRTLWQGCAVQPHAVEFRPETASAYKGNLTGQPRCHSSFQLHRRPKQLEIGLLIEV